ncbi:hypothetical protein ZWY2020_035929 [Hordeum vulgare]|nr:hypothetical protein ZWY2020_035929 [Hordeum vulgare]
MERSSKRIPSKSMSFSQSMEADAESMDAELIQVANGFEYKVLKDGGKGSKALRGSFFVRGWRDGYFHSCLASSESLLSTLHGVAASLTLATPVRRGRPPAKPRGTRGRGRGRAVAAMPSSRPPQANSPEHMNSRVDSSEVEATRSPVHEPQVDEPSTHETRVPEASFQARHNKTEVPQMYDLYAMAHTASYKKVMAFSESDLGHRENFTNISSHHKLVKYTDHGKARKGEDLNPSEGPIDPELLMIAGNGRPHGSIAIGDGLIRCPSTLRQIKARHRSSCREITPRPRPVELAIKAAILKEREAMQAVLAEKDKEMKELEERTTALVEAERTQNDASNRAIYELFVNISRNAWHNPSTVEPSAGQPSLGETSQSHRASPP